MGNRSRAAALLFAIAFTSSACSSTYVPRPSPRISVVLKHGSPMLVKAGREYQLGSFGAGLLDAVEGNPAAEEQAEMFRSRNITGFLMTLGSTPVLASGAALGVSSMFSNPQSSDGLAIAGGFLMSAGLGLAIAGLVLGVSAPRHFWDAINIYNDGVLPPPAAPYPTYPPPARWPAPAIAPTSPAEPLPPAPPPPPPMP